jgi:hypothetical protein
MRANDLPLVAQALSPAYRASSQLLAFSDGVSRIERHLTHLTPGELFGISE